MLLPQQHSSKLNDTGKWCDDGQGYEHAAKKSEWIIFNAINRSCGDFLIGKLTPDARAWDYDYKLDEFAVSFIIIITVIASYSYEGEWAWFLWALRYCKTYN